MAFLIPHNIAAGGPPGVAILLNYFTGFAIGWGMFLVNMTLILISYKKFGGIYFVKTLVAVAALSIFSDVLTYLINGFIITDYRIINAVLGGLCAGFGIGLVSSRLQGVSLLETTLDFAAFLSKLFVSTERCR